MNYSFLKILFNATKYFFFTFSIMLSFINIILTLYITINTNYYFYQLTKLVYLNFQVQKLEPNFFYFGPNIKYLIFLTSI